MKKIFSDTLEASPVVNVDGELIFLKPIKTRKFISYLILISIDFCYDNIFPFSSLFLVLIEKKYTKYARDRLSLHFQTILSSSKILSCRALEIPSQIAVKRPPSGTLLIAALI